MDPWRVPSGNKAELGVQQLKEATRKLLITSKVPNDLWPLAVLHASNRNWLLMCEALGAPTLSLLPFGQVLHARKRLKHADKSSWGPRTVRGKYLGQAPSTPGGHLVWIEDVDGPKVLLTNTVYPIRPSDPPARKPAYRLFHKTPLDFALKTVMAWQVSCSPQVFDGLFAQAVARSELGGSGLQGIKTLG